jgi:catechol 2,3-dioxygenase-like lactoylglutathione lyase family enzyme
MPTVNGILETALYVADVSKAAEFYRRLFGFGTLLEVDRLIALDVTGRNVLLLFKGESTKQPFETPGGVIPSHWATGPAHFAFSISQADVPAWREQLAANGVAIESTVNWPTGAVSIYFRDPDNHLVELITPGFWRIY